MYTQKEYFEDLEDMRKIDITKPFHPPSSAFRKITTQIKNTFFNDENVNKKTMVIDVNCFSFTGDYVCPHYHDSFSSDKELREEVWDKHCRKCWNK